MRFVLERENKSFLGRKEENYKLLGEEVIWFFFGRTNSFGIGRTKVGGLNLMMARIFLRELIIASLFDLTWLVLVIGTPHHGLKARLWVSWLKINQEEYFWSFNTYNIAYIPQCMWGAIICTQI